MISPELALSVACRASCVALGVGILEQLTVFDRAFGTRGPFSPRITKVMGAAAFTRGLPSKALRCILVVAAIASILGAVLGPSSPLGRSALATLLVCVVIARVRRVMGSDGAEQMAILVLFAACIAFLAGLKNTTMMLAVWFVGGQSILGYVTSGVAKAISPTWRGGAGLSLVMGSEAHGQPAASAVLEAFPRLAKLLTWSVIIFECSFPLILVVPKSFALVMLSAGFAFHLACAISMGLNAFLFAFPGTYVCVAYIAQRTSPYW